MTLVLPSVPDYETFLTVDEAVRNALDLASSAPDLARCVEIGRSTDGEPVRMLRIGDGNEQLLFIGCPHPNEPIGMLTIDLLAHRLVEDDDLRGTRFTWNLIPCADPDAARLNEGWFAGPFSLSDYARGFYRPPFGEQAILTFPFVRRGYAFLRPMPETRALITAMTALRPRFIASLHNAALGGGYYYLSPNVPELGDPLRRLLAERGIPLSLGEPELPWGIEHSLAVFDCTTMDAHVDFLVDQGTPDPTSRIDAGDTTYGFARRVCDPVFLICEVPYFTDPRIADTRSTDAPRRTSVLEGIDRASEILGFLGDMLKRMNGRWTTNSRFRRAVEAIVPQAIDGERARRRWTERSDEFDEPATVAQAFSNRLETPYYHVLNVGTLRRALRYECDAAGRSNDVARAALAEVDERFDAWLGDFEAAIDYRVMPIEDLVEVQLASALRTIDTL